MICICLLFAGIVSLGHLFRPVDTDDATAAIRIFQELPANSVEVLNYGSSHAWRTLDSRRLYEMYGIGSYNDGCNWQTLGTTQLFFRDSLLSQKPKVALIETVNVGNLKKDVDMDGEIYYTRGIRWKAGKMSYLRSTFAGDPGRFLSYFFPLFAFHENRANLSDKSWMWNSNTVDFRSDFGFYGLDGVIPVDLRGWDETPQEELPADCVQVLDEIMERADAEGVQVVFYTVPYDTNTAPFAYFDAMQAYADTHDAAYLNLFANIEEWGLDEATDFHDTGHLNLSGAAKCTDYLGAYLSAHYDLTDFREQEHSLWKDGF